MPTQLPFSTARKPATGLIITLVMMTLLFLAAPFRASADIITLKSGETVEGRIIAEGTDMVRIEVQVTSSIKETKTFAMKDVASITKAAADKVAFAVIKESLPTRSLMSSTDYDDLIRNGPKRFLSTFPESFHANEVKTILADLEKEKDMVQRGSIKLNDEWISREHRNLYRFDIEARIRLYNMNQKAAANNALGALRDFETIEKRYAETPAHAAALATVLELIPSWGSNLQRRLSNVEILNAQDEVALKNAKEDERAQVEAARAAEEQRYAATIEQEKEKGITWTTVNFRSKESLAGAVTLATEEMARLRGIDAAALATKSEMLYEANRLVGEGKLTAARAKIAEATGSSSSSKSRSRSRSRSSSGVTVPTSYSKWLLERIKAEEDAITEAAQAKAAAQEGGSAAKDALLAAGAAATPGEEGAMPPKAAGEGDAEAGDKTADEEGAASATPTRAELVAAERARMDAKRAEEEKAAAAAAAAEEKKPKKSTSSKKDDEEEEEEKPKRESSGGGLSFQKIMPIIAVILVITVLIMKKLGIGGTKE